MDIYSYSSPSGPYRSTLQMSSASSFRQPKHKEINELGKDLIMGRRARRAVKREMVDETVMSKHEQNLIRLRESRQAKT